MKRAERKLRRHKKHCAEWPSYPDGDIRNMSRGHEITETVSGKRYRITVEEITDRLATKGTEA